MVGVDDRAPSVLEGGGGLIIFTRITTEQAGWLCKIFAYDRYDEWVERSVYDR